jgi:nitrogen fixation protein NifU and related proteins
MSLEDDLYKEIILENYRSTRNKGPLDHPDMHAEGANPSCGDDLELFLSLDGNTITAARYDGVGCSICCASTNMLCEALKGRTLTQAREILTSFKEMLLNQGEPDFDDDISDLEVMQGVRNYPVRIKCALLAWNTLEEMLESKGV